MKKIAYFFGLVILLSGCDDLSPQAIRDRQHLPRADFVADKKTGKDLFDKNCIRCHGKNASGSRQGPPLVNKIYRPAHHADITFHWAVKSGVKAHHWQFGDMPTIPGLSPEDVGHIIAYVRNEQRKAGIR